MEIPLPPRPSFLQSQGGLGWSGRVCWWTKYRNSHRVPVSLDVSSASCGPQESCSIWLSPWLVSSPTRQLLKEAANSGNVSLTITWWCITSLLSPCRWSFPLQGLREATFQVFGCMCGGALAVGFFPDPFLIFILDRILPNWQVAQVRLNSVILLSQLPGGVTGVHHTWLVDGILLRQRETDHFFCGDEAACSPLKGFSF